MIDKDILFNRKDAITDLRQVYEENGTISWSAFDADQKGMRNRVVELNNADFENGTLRVRQPCLLKLNENIVFNPNRPKKWLDDEGNITTDFSQAVGIYENRTFDWERHVDAPNNEQYFEPEVRFAYKLGFFAAIAIESTFTIVDLNGYSISQHKEHYLQQRFFSVIELADQPFIPIQGPSNFGHILRSARDVYIYNGKIGLSSHHGIHGNSNDGVFFENIVFEDFEVAPIALNGAKNVMMQNINVRKNNHNIPVMGTYSAGRFNRFITKNLVADGLGTGGLTSSVNLLNKRLNMAFDSFIFGRGYIPKLFENPSGLIDGNAYGIVINPTGVAVNGFLATRDTPQANETSNIYIENTSINGIHSKVNEIVGIDNGAGSAQVGPVGATLQFFNFVSDLRNGKYFYKGTALSDVKIEIAKIKQNLIDTNDPAQTSKFFGTNNISRGVQMWYDNRDWYFKMIESGKLQLYNDINMPVLIGGKPVIHNVLCNSDTMFHVNKGTMGLRMDGCNGALLHNCMITNIKGYGGIGSDLCGHYIKSHPAQTNMIGYHGNNVYGAILCAVNDITIQGLNIVDISSATGLSKGFSIVNESANSCIDDLTIKNISAGVNMNITEEVSMLPNKLPIATGFNSGHNVTNLKIKNINVKQINNNENVPYHKPFDINGCVHIN